MTVAHYIPNLFIFFFQNREGEIPSANAHCSARGLAKVASAMANGGIFNGTGVLSPRGLEAMMAEPVRKKDGLIPGLVTTFTQGGINVFR